MVHKYGSRAEILSVLSSGKRFVDVAAIEPARVQIHSKRKSLDTLLVVAIPSFASLA